MEWSFNSQLDENGREVDGEFNILGRTYTYEDDKLQFILGGIGLATVFSVVFTSMIYILFTLLTMYSWAIVGILEIVLAGLVLISFIGGLKYVVTGDARPFVKVESEENKKRITFLEW